MTEKQAEEMIATLKRMELILMNIANNTVHGSPMGMPKTFYYTTPMPTTTSYGSVSSNDVRRDGG